MSEKNSGKPSGKVKSLGPDFFFLRWELKEGGMGGSGDFLEPVATWNSAHETKKQCNFDSGRLERQQRGLHSVF